MPRIGSAAPARVTQPTYEQLQTRLTTLTTKIAGKAKELQTHKDVMARSRYTPEGLKTATTKLKTLEKELTNFKTEHKNLKASLATMRPASKTPTTLELTAGIERALKSGTLEYGAKAPKAADILTQTTVHKRPFSYTAIVLKSDPNNMIIKKVLTGGFAPARPGDGSYSKPVPVNLARIG